MADRVIVTLEIVPSGDRGIGRSCHGVIETHPLVSRSFGFSELRKFSGKI
jgi:hypothetical protein